MGGLRFFFFSSPVGLFLACLLVSQGGGGKLLDAALGQEGALDGLELRSRLGVLQGGVGGRHGTLGCDKQKHQKTKQNSSGGSDDKCRTGFGFNIVISSDTANVEKIESKK